MGYVQKIVLLLNKKEAKTTILGEEGALAFINSVIQKKATSIVAPVPGMQCASGLTR